MSTYHLVISERGGQGRDVLDALLAGDEPNLNVYCVEGGRDHDMAPYQSLSELDIEPGARYFFSAWRSPQATALLDGSFAGVRLSNVIHPQAYVSLFSQLGQNVFVGAMAVVNPQVQLEDFVFVNAGCVLDHDCRIGRGTSMGPGCSFPGHVTIGENCAIGAGVVARPGVTVASGCTLGAGAVIVKDLEVPGVYVGNPARLLAQ